MHYLEVISLEDYERPAGPAVNRLEVWYQSIVQKITTRNSEVSVTEDQLSKASAESIRSFAVEPDCQFVFQALDRTYLEWMKSAAADDHLRMLVFPPCDRSSRVALWAEKNNFDVLAAPDRAELLSADEVDVVIPEGSGPLVVPRLEDWFIRHRRGLRHIRALLTALQRTSRVCLVSCNSWCWLYLKKAANADLVLPAPDSLTPMNAEGLGRWLLDAVTEGSSQAVTFRDQKDGEEILSRDDDGKVSDGFLEQLSDDSGGIPWVAWQMWRRSLRTRAKCPDTGEENAEALEQEKKSDGDELVFWVIRNQPLSLPRGHERTARLLLQALLVHDSLPEHILSSVLPSIGESNLIVALIRSGFVERHGEEVRCLSVAYPVIWKSLADSGMTMAHF